MNNQVSDGASGGPFVKNTLNTRAMPSISGLLE